MRKELKKLRFPFLLWPLPFGSWTPVWQQESQVLAEDTAAPVRRAGAPLRLRRPRSRLRRAAVAPSAFVALARIYVPNRGRRRRASRRGAEGRGRAGHGTGRQTLAPTPTLQAAIITIGTAKNNMCTGVKTFEGGRIRPEFGPCRQRRSARASLVGVVKMKLFDKISACLALFVPSCLMKRVPKPAVYLKRTKGHPNNAVYGGRSIWSDNRQNGGVGGARGMNAGAGTRI
ncbi:hypothetical protein EVAR_99610_1 [Eumeta japonica]|uniref:Uncharacterized protein n=1 Tax=Eumeta variegata TaxID=151549 RepID=A0A4C1SYA2_EUMVA|nr:hypothetical protein EVAR_99610_1 [Eumeta japonica]